MAGFDWDDANRTHIARHGASVKEAEEVCASDTLYLESHVIDGEERVQDLGITLAGRILVILTTERGERVRVVTAYDAPPRLKKIYLSQW